MAMKTVKINLGKDFSKLPSGRDRSDGPYSGERFREDFLEPHLRNGTPVEVDLSDVEGLSSSFYEEAFGGRH